MTDTEVSDADTLPLGVFHEVSISVPDLAASLAFYEAIGWQQVPVRTVWPHPYAALTDGAVTLGLHQYRFPSPSVTCVHPDIAAALESHRDAGMVIAFAQTGPDRFNEFGFRDPHGHMVTLLEAPTHDAPALSVAGSGRRSFLTLPATDIDLGLRFWTVLGARPGPTPPADWPCRRFEAGGLPLALHDPALLDRPAIVCDGIERRLAAPEGTPILPTGG